MFRPASWPLLLVSAATAPAQQARDLLERLDSFARGFTGVRASVRMTTHTPPLDDRFDTVDTGLLTIRRVSPSKTLYMVEFSDPPKTLILRQNTVDIYHPKTNEYEELDLRKYRDLAQRMLTLAFGTSGKELARDYEIRDLRNDLVDGQNSTHVELAPKAADVKKYVERVELWIAQGSNCPVRQKLYLPSGEYKITEFSDVHVNPVIPAAVFDLPRGAKRVKIN